MASTHWLATSVAVTILHDGGNAFDAAAAAGFTLQVVEPHLNGPAGEVPILVRPHDGEARVICGQGASPATAEASRFTREGLDLIPGTGLLAACVPGAFDGWLTLLEHYGTMPLRRVLSPAIGFARSGYPLVEQASAAIANVAEVFLKHWPTSAQLYLRAGRAPEPGSRVNNPELADLYEAILRESETTPGRTRGIERARAAFYNGFVADRIDRYCREAKVVDATGRAHSALLRGQDLASHTTPIEPTASVVFGDYRVHKTGPWGQGPVLLQQLNLLETMGIDTLTPDSAEYHHVLVECAKLAFADREAWYGDPNFTEIPLEDLLSRGYAEDRAGLVGKRASTELLPGSPGGLAPQLASLGQHRDRSASMLSGGGEPTMQTFDRRFGPTDGDTCHVDIADQWGNLVSATPSGGWLQSSPVIPGLGFALGTRAQMFWLEQGLPNSLQPGKRPRTTLSPGLAERDGEPYLAFGTPGGDGQDQWALQMFLRHTVHGADLRAAIDAPAMQSNHFPSSFHPRQAHPGRLMVEARMPRDIREGLSARGHEVLEVGPWSLGRLCAVRRDRESGMMEAAADTRSRQAYAVVL